MGVVADDLEARLRAVAMIVAAVALLTASIGLVVTRRGQVQVNSKLGDVKLTLGQVHEEVKAVNHAVNHVTEDDPAPMIDRIRDLESHGRWERTVLTMLGRHLGVTLPPHPKDQTA